LREAREAQGLTVDEAAARLRLMHRQVEAMEAGDFDALGQPVFARGFVRNYARLLGLPADALLEQMQGTMAEPVAVTRAEPPLPSSWLTSPWLVLMFVGLLMIVAVPVGLYLWLNSEPEETVPAPAVAQPRPAPVIAPAAVVPPVEPAVPAVDTAALPALPSGNEAAEAPPAPAETSGPSPSAPAPVAAPVPVPPAAPAPAAPAPAVPSTGALHLEFDADAWTEIHDAQRRPVHRQLNRAGSSVDVQGQPPFRVVIGNAAQARVTYNGRAVDLKPHIDVTVARFTLGD
jgi:cytoskeleton protein RodZ